MAEDIIGMERYFDNMRAAELARTQLLLDKILAELTLEMDTLRMTTGK